jgi:dTDP-4-dehydrorhamnose reductase
MNERLILVFGRSGILASALAEATPPPGFVIRTMGRNEADLSCRGLATTMVEALKPAFIINAAAYTIVDAAETSREAADVLNRDAPAELARVCAVTNTPFVHVSTDYVFDGRKGLPYETDDATGPVNHYGVSKLEGERIIPEAIEDAPWACIRTSWVYGAAGQGFPTSFLNACRNGHAKAIGDKWGSPTSAEELARACLEVGRRLLNGDDSVAGISHFGGLGGATRADQAMLIADRLVAHGHPRPHYDVVDCAALHLAAPRPNDTRLSSARLIAAGIRPDVWQEAMTRMMHRMLSA